MGPDIYEMHAEVCKALAHPIRLRVISLLDCEELHFSELLGHIGGLKSNLSQHLSIMCRKGILISRKEGQHTYFSLSSPKVAEACQLMKDVLAAHISQQKAILENTEA